MSTTLKSILFVVAAVLCTAATVSAQDGIRVTDLISPMDYTEFLAQDYDDIRVPVGALRVRYLHNSWSLEAVAVPIPEFFKIPTDSLNPWSMGPLPTEVRPDKDIENMEYGGRFSCFLGGVDFSLMALRTWSKIPELIDDHGNHLGNALAGLDWYPGADWNVQKI